MLEEETAGLRRSPEGETAYIEANNMTVRFGKSMNTSLNVMPLQILTNSLAF